MDKSIIAQKNLMSLNLKLVKSTYFALVEKVNINLFVTFKVIKEVVIHLKHLL
jgi:hypothetical protein